jgi:uncharacterized protein DUF5758/pentapeptide repeat protein
MSIEIKNRWTGVIIIAGEYENVREAVLKSTENGANLSGADLYGANLRSATLRSANLSGANLSGADLRSATLRSANLSGANLSGADLYGANLSGATLRSANLSGANLYGANLYGANLSGATLRSAKNIPALADARASILPEVGQFIGWKKCNAGVLVRLMVGKNARRSNATGRKCRAEYIKVLEVIGATVGISQHDNKTKYEVGKIVRCDSWNEDRWVECGGGIHFFLTKVEAENY